MQQLTTRPATYAEVEALPPKVVGEILFGVLHTQARPAPRHGYAAGILGSEFIGTYRFGRGGPGGWVVIVEPELHFGSHVVVPDIAGWRKERLPAMPDTAWIVTPPDWVAENLSPSTMRIDRTDKLAVYASFGVSHAWYVDPLVLTLEVFELVASRWQIERTFKDADPVCAPPFEAHTFPLDILCPEAPPA
ncbi:MAG TPA: Uma2 family endonuclease [Hyphomicrobiaceae bacterium]|nr:Uma2 family endonuclease [Hyphomicrobiaceae bacterium]